VGSNRRRHRPATRGLYPELERAHQLVDSETESRPSLEWGHQQNWRSLQRLGFRLIFPPFTSEPIETSNGVSWFNPRENYASPFGKQWEMWSRTQLDSQTNLPLSRQRLRRVLGPLWESLGDLSVLEVGCGAGRFTEVLLSRGAMVTAVDISSAVEVCAASFGSSKRFRAVGASVTSLPFSHGQFDVVVCLGVIQHTPEPRRTIESLWEQVRPGGFLVVDQYRHSLSSWLRTTWAFRFFLKRLAPEAGVKITNMLVRTLLPMHRLVRGKRFLELLLNRLSPITSHYSTLPLSEEQQIEWAQLNTHDNLTDRYKFHTTRRRMERILTGLGCSDFYSRELPYTVELIGRKPDELDHANVLGTYT